MIPNSKKQALINLIQSEDSNNIDLVITLLLSKGYRDRFIKNFIYKVLMEKILNAETTITEEILPKQVSYIWSSNTINYKIKLNIRRVNFDVSNYYTYTELTMNAGFLELAYVSSLPNNTNKDLDWRASVYEWNPLVITMKKVLEKFEKCFKYNLLTRIKEIKSHL